MAEKSAVDQLSEHYGDVGFRLVETDDGDDGPGMSGREARAFLRGLRPVAVARQSLKAAAKALKPGA